MNAYNGKYLNVVIRNNHECVERINFSGIVGIVAIDKEELLLVEQWREPVKRVCLELPSGICGDLCKEDLLDGANRELEEETGYRAEKLTILGEFPLTPGMTNEVMTLILATDIIKVGAGGGVDNENITIRRFHPLQSHMKLMQLTNREDGISRYIDAKVLAGIHIARLYLQNPIASLLGETFDRNSR